MGSPVKYLFEEDFATGKVVNAKPTVPLATHEAEIARVQAEAYRNGMAAGDTKIEGRTATACERIAQGIAALTQSLTGVENKLEAEAVEVAVAVARKLAPELIAAEPLREIEELAASCFRQLVAAPHVVVRIAEPIYEAAHKRLEDIARLHGFAGRLVVLAEPGIALGDCKIEWADGGLARDRVATDTAIGEAVGRYIASRRSGISQ